MDGAGAPVEVLKTESRDFTGAKPQGGKTDDDRAVPKAAWPGDVERSKHLGQLVVAQRPRQGRLPPGTATMGIAASSGSSQRPSTLRKRKNERSAVRTVFIERAENRPFNEATNVITSEGWKRLGINGISDVDGADE